ncbi:MAG: FadR/GntR family transcriptional regulator [Pseudomonadota bacterium]
MSQINPENRIRGKSQPQRVVDGVTARIDDGALKPGDRVPPEPELMREFGVSRTVVREAMSRLQASGRVETRHGIGTFVLEPGVGVMLLGKPAGQIKIRQRLAMLELRISIESEAASLAALRRSDQHLAAMRAALDAYDIHRRAGSATIDDDCRFHVQIAAATGNEYFEEVLCNLGSATMSARGQPGESAGIAGGRTAAFGDSLLVLAASKEITQREHEAIYEAIRRGDAGSARAAMFMHLSNSRERLRDKVGDLLVQ